MAAKWSDVRRTHSAKVERESRAWVRAEAAKVPLRQMRKARAMTQVSIARRLNVNQAAISQMESRSDMYLSTLRAYVEALGGTLDIRAQFPEGEILLNDLTDLNAPPRSAGGADATTVRATPRPPKRKKQAKARAA